MCQHKNERLIQLIPQALKKSLMVGVGEKYSLFRRRRALELHVVLKEIVCSSGNPEHLSLCQCLQSIGSFGGYFFQLYKLEFGKSRNYAEFVHAGRRYVLYSIW